MGRRLRERISSKFGPWLTTVVLENVMLVTLVVSITIVTLARPEPLSAECAPIRIHHSARSSTDLGRYRNGCRPNSGCRSCDRNALRAAMVSNRRNPCWFSTKPRPAPIHRRAPKPNRRDASGPIVRNDTSPTQTVLRRPTSNRRQYRPTGRRYRASNCGPQPRAAADEAVIGGFAPVAQRLQPPIERPVRSRRPRLHFASSLHGLLVDRRFLWRLDRRFDCFLRRDIC